MTDLLNALVLFANFVLVPGIAYGAQLALGALGVTLIYSILRFANFAHGDLMAFGTMITILVTWWLQSLGVSIDPLPTALIALPVGMAGAVAFSLLADRTVFKFYRVRKAPAIVVVMASVGIMFMLNGIVRFVIGPDDQRFADGARFIIRARDFRTMTGLEEGLTIRLPVLITVVVAFAVVVWLFWFLQKTRTGKAMRAYSDNEDLALLSGINPERVVLITWIIAASLATVAGTLYGLDKSFKPFIYFQLLLPIFASAIVGGVGHPFGAVAGGFIVAFSEIVITYPFKLFLDYLGFAPDGLLQLLSTEYKFAISFVILVIVLLIRPTGLFRGKVL